MGKHSAVRVDLSGIIEASLLEVPIREGSEQGGELNWSEAERRIRKQVVPGTTAVLKCDGVERRKVTSNRTDRIGMRTGVSTNQTKTISYDMLCHAFETLQATGRFDSEDFRRKFAKKYEAAPCRYSMTGGVLVEVGLAKLVAGRGEDACYYVIEPS